MKEKRDYVHPAQVVISSQRQCRGVMRDRQRLVDAQLILQHYGRGSVGERIQPVIEALQDAVDRYYQEEGND